jgi:hypothetical protein
MKGTFATAPCFIMYVTKCNPSYLILQNTASLKYNPRYTTEIDRIGGDLLFYYKSAD